MTIEYPYVESDCLSQPNSYAYAPYAGEAFLEAWRRSRQSVLDSLPPPAEPPAIDCRGTINGGDTLAYLDAVWQRLQEQNKGASADLDPLVRSFEIHKRIYRHYTDRWQPTDQTGFRDPAPYLRFAETLDLAYRATGSLPYLNTLLKCLDILTAICAILPYADGGRLARLIVREREFVDTLESDVQERT